MRGASLLMGIGCASVLLLAGACGSERPPISVQDPDASTEEGSGTGANGSGEGAGYDLGRCSCTVPKFTWPCEVQLCTSFATYTCLSHGVYTTEIPCGDYDAGADAAPPSSPQAGASDAAPPGKG